MMKNIFFGALLFVAGLLVGSLYLKSPDVEVASLQVEDHEYQQKYEALRSQLQVKTPSPAKRAQKKEVQPAVRGVDE